MRINNQFFFILLFLGFGKCSYSQKLTPCRCTETGPGNYGYCDSLRIKVIVKCQFDSAYSFSNGLARIVKGGKTGYVDLTGKTIIPTVYERGEDFSEGFAFVKKDGHSFYINKTGVNQFKKNFPLPAPPKIEEVNDGVKKILAQQETAMRRGCRFYEGMAMFFDTANKKIGFIDNKGNVAIQAKYIHVTPFTEGVSFVKEGITSPVFAIDKKGKKLFEIDLNTRVLPDGYKNGFAVVTGKFGGDNYTAYNYIDKTGKLLLPAPVKRANPFEDNYAIITNNEDDMVLINSKGVKMFDQPLKYFGNSAIKGIYFYSNEPSRGFGLMDISGNRITKPGYDNFTKLNDSVFLCKPWGSTVFTLLSIHSGEIFFFSRFTKYVWISDAKKPTIRLLGTDVIQGNISLDYETPTGKFLKEGKEIPTKDNHYLAINNIKTEKEKVEEEKKLKPGIVKYENKYFSIRFPKEMEVFKDTVNRTVYTSYTYFFSIEKIIFKGDYLEAVKNRFQSLGKYDNFKYELLALEQGNLKILLCSSKKVSGEKQAQFFFTVLDNGKTNSGSDEIYVLSGNYFVMDESIYGSQFRSTLYSLKIK